MTILNSKTVSSLQPYLTLMILVKLIKSIYQSIKFLLAFASTSLVCGAGLLATTNVANASDYVEFDPNLLHKVHSKNPIDISRFFEGNSLLPGKYRLSVWINDVHYGQLNLRFKVTEDEKDVQMCVNQELIDNIDLQKKWKNKLLKAIETNDCLSLEKFLPNTSIKLDAENLNLSISIDKSLLNVRPQGYIDPANWDKGVNSAFTTYNFNHYYYKNGDKDSNNSYLNLNSGINVDGWQLRHNSVVTKTEKDDWDYQGINTYVHKNLPDWQSLLTLGYFYTGNNWQDNISIRGLQLASDERMLPYSQQGFAPIIRGTAQTNALVQIFQKGKEIYNTTVSAGNFEIKDLYPLYQNGELTLVITEANGKKRQRKIDIQANTGSLRAGANQWQFAIGHLRKDNYDIYPDYLLQGAWSHGVNNNLSLHTGLTHTKNYTGALLGANLNLPIGALSTSVKHTKADIDKNSYSGNRYKLHFNRHFPQTDTGVSLSSEWFSSADYPKFSDYVIADNKQNNLFSPTKRKNRLSVDFRQTLPNDWGNLYLNASRETFWDKKNKQNEWQIGYGNHFKGIDYQLTAEQTQFINGDDKQKDRSYYLSVSFPFGKKENHTVQTSVNNYNDNNRFDIGVYGYLDDIKDFNKLYYGISASRDQATEKNSLSANVNYTNPYNELRGTYSQTDGDNYQLSFGLSGAVVGHKGGVNFAKNLGETFAIVHAEGAKGAEVEGTSEQLISSFGYGIAPSLTPYRKNTIGIDPQGLPINLQIDATTAEVVPQAGSSVLVDLKSRVERSRLFAIRLADGSNAPLGAILLDEKNKELGFVAQNGRAFARGLNTLGKIKLTWKNDSEKHCSFNYQLKDDDKQLNHLKLDHVNCF